MAVVRHLGFLKTFNIAMAVVDHWPNIYYLAKFLQNLSTVAEILQFILFSRLDLWDTLLDHQHKKL